MEITLDNNLEKSNDNELYVGGSLFPMLYIYYKATDESKLSTVIVESFNKYIKENIDTNIIIPKNIKDNYKSIINNNAIKYNKQMINVFNKNKTLLWELSNSVSTLMSKYKSRLPKNKGSYYEGIDGNGTSWFPILNTKDPNNFSNIMESFRLMLNNNLIDYDYNTGIRSISLSTGKIAKSETIITYGNDNNRILGLPSNGVFTTMNASKTNWMYHTFTGKDLSAIATINDQVTELDGLSSLSWSIHRGKTTARPLGKVSPSGRAVGSRTIAGTLVFTAADHNPILDIIPNELPYNKKEIKDKKQTQWRNLLMSDQIPPFDLLITMINEYGYASIFMIYGMEITDEGGVINKDNLATEIVLQYTAVAIDPIVEAKLDEKGLVDPYGILQGGYSQMWKRREEVIAGVSFSNLSETFETQYDEIDNMYQKLWTR